MKVEIISATRLSQADFQAKSALGLSLLRLADDSHLIARVNVSNTRGLPAVYNDTLALADDDSIVVFMHDDVWIEDYFFAQRLIEGLKTYDVIGVAGNRRRVPEQPGWAFVDRRFTWDERQNLSGTMAHGKQPFGPLVHYGAAPADCELLDGVLLAARKSVLVAANVAFDPRFDFDFYDMDFCRSARQRGLRLGTWPICLTHESDGSYGTPHWMKSYALYLEKWGS